MAHASESRVVIAAAAAYSVANAASWLQPVLLPELLTAHGMTEMSAGLLLTLEMLALSLSCALYARLAKDVPFVVLLAVGTAFAVLGNVLSLLVGDYRLLLLTRLLCGLGEGAALMVATAALAHLADPDRAYAQINAAAIVTGTLLVYAAPVIGRLTGGPMTFPALILCFICLLPLLLLMPRAERLERTPGSAQSAAFSPSLILVLIGVLLFAFVNATPWAFLQILGERSGLSAAAVNHTLTVAIILSLAGSAAAGWLGNRLGRCGPVVAGLSLITVALVGLSLARDPAVYRVSVSAFMIALYFVLPYLFGFAAAEDPSGRGAAAAGSLFLLSFALGPFVGSALFGELGYSVMGPIAALTNTTVVIIFWWVARAARARLAPLSSVTP